MKADQNPIPLMWELYKSLGSWRAVGALFNRSSGWAHLIAHGKRSMGKSARRYFIRHHCYARWSDAPTSELRRALRERREV